MKNSEKEAKSISTNPEEMQITPEQKIELEKQAYRLVGHHSAVKICGWTKNHLIRKGICYKYAFYGIRSHQCLQMTTSMFCASRCVFCWRGEKAPVSKTWYGHIDEPEAIINQALIEQQELLQGFNGNPNADLKLVEEMKDVRHVALSLTGEPITYPKINEITEAFHKRRISSFIVTNAQYPEEIRNLKNVTQLYLSLDAPNMELFKKVDRPLFIDYEKRIIESLDALRECKSRTCLRITAIKNLNMTDIDGYRQLIERGQPDFIEVKAYMHVGASKNMLDYSQMPMNDEMRDFAKKIVAILPDYMYVVEHTPSRVILLAKKSMANKTFIDFHKFFDAVNSGKQITAEEYSVEKMQPND